MDIPNCNFTNTIGHKQGPCCLEECDHTSEETICEYECPKDMFLSNNMLWDKNGEACVGMDVDKLAQKITMASG